MSKDLRAAINDLLLDVIRNGVECLDANGQPILDESGNPIRKKAPAAFAAQAINWVKYNEAATPGGIKGTPVENLEAALRDGSLKFPEMSDEPDAATGTEG